MDLFPSRRGTPKNMEIKKNWLYGRRGTPKKMDLLRQEGSPKYIGKIYEKVGNTVFNKNGNFVVGLYMKRR